MEKLNDADNVIPKGPHRDLLFRFYFLPPPIERNQMTGDRRRKKYGLGHFLFDFFMTCITGGLWLIWLLFRFFHANS